MLRTQDMSKCKTGTKLVTFRFTKSWSNYDFVIKPKCYQFSSRLAFTHILSSQDDSIRSMFSTRLLKRNVISTILWQWERILVQPGFLVCGLRLVCWYQKVYEHLGLDVLPSCYDVYHTISATDGINYVLFNVFHFLSHITEIVNQ